jgi:hypothetical protein
LNIAAETEFKYGVKNDEEISETVQESND